MSKKTIITILLALVALTGWTQSTKTATITGYSPALKDGTLVFASTGPCASVVDTVQAGRFAYDIETDFPKLYNIFFLKQYETGRLFLGKFIAENCHVNVTMYEDQKPCIVVNGEEGCKHPMLYKLYDVLDAIQILKHSEAYANFDKSQYEQCLTLYHDTLINYYPSHPIHEQIAYAEATYRLQPGKPYIDYTVRNNDGQLVPISTLTKGKVTLIDLWASWCGPCRQHSIAMIPIYERYKEKGFTIIAIARERNRKAMENAVMKDGYPWQSLLELNDENQVWRKNGTGNASKAATSTSNPI